MKKKINSLKLLLLVGLLAGPLAFNATAATREDIQWSPLVTWTDGFNTYAAWDDANNWGGGVVPVIVDTNQVFTFYNATYNSSVICVVSNNTQVTSVGQLMCGFGGAGTLLVTNGAHFQAGFSGFGDTWTGIGYIAGPGDLEIGPGSDVTLAGHLWVGQAPRQGTVVVNGGTLHVPGGELGVSWDGNPDPTVTNRIYVINGGSVYLRDWAGKTLGQPGSPGNIGVMDIGANSQVVITNNALSFMPILIASNQLIAFGVGTISAVYNPGNNTTVLTALAPQGPTTPIFSVQPTNVIVTKGGTATLTATASPATGYQWMFNSVPLSNGNGISGATTATLTVANFVATEAGVYSVVATNSAASPSDRSYTSSQPASVTAESFNLYPVITINGINGSTYVSQYATSVSGPYTSFSTNTAGTGPVNVIDTTSPLNMTKFYRVFQP